MIQVKYKGVKLSLHPTLPERQLEQSSKHLLQETTIFFTTSLLQGKMTFYLCFFLTILICLSSRYSFVEIKLELQKNILKFGYRINYKYDGMLEHSFDRFYVVTKFILPTLDDLKLSPIKYDKECTYI